LLIFTVTLFLSYGVLPAQVRALTGHSQETSRSPKLQDVRRIYVGEMGEGDEARRFRLLLEDELVKKDFTVVSRPQDADAVLTGALSVRVHDEKTRARVYVTLHTPDGTRLWGKDFGSKIFKISIRTSDPVKMRAEDVAGGLRDEWKKAAKNAGRY
jgi:hypothetical protein